MKQTKNTIRSEATGPDLTPLISTEDMLEHFEETTPKILRGPHSQIMRLPKGDEWFMDGVELTKLLRMP